MTLQQIVDSHLAALEVIDQAVSEVDGRMPPTVFHRLFGAREYLARAANEEIQVILGDDVLDRVKEMIASNETGV